MPAPQPISLTERRSGGSTTRARVYAGLRDAIVRTELVPGRQLSENELAASLGVSRTPVREALVRLRDDRLVEIVPQLGTFVSPISTRAVADAQFIREALECAAVRVAAARVTAEDVETLEHREIVARLAENDPDGAEMALRHHLQMVLREVPRIREQHPDFFEEG